MYLRKAKPEYFEICKKILVKFERIHWKYTLHYSSCMTSVVQFTISRHAMLTCVRCTPYWCILMYLHWHVWSCACRLQLVVYQRLSSESSISDCSISDCSIWLDVWSTKIFEDFKDLLLSKRKKKLTNLQSYKYLLELKALSRKENVMINNTPDSIVFVMFIMCR